MKNVRTESGNVIEVFEWPCRRGANQGRFSRLFRARGLLGLGVEEIEQNRELG